MAKQFVRTMSWLGFWLIVSISLPVMAAYNLALLNIKPLDLDSIGFDGDLQYALRSGLDKTGQVQLMSQRDMESELFRNGMTPGATLQQALKAGQALGVSYVVFGTITKPAQSIDAEISVVDVVNQRIAKSWTIAFSSPSDITVKAGALAQPMLAAIKASAEQAKQSAAVAEVKKDQVKLLTAFESLNQDTGVLVKWQAEAPEQVLHYNLYRGEALSGPFVQVAQVEGGSFLDSNVKDKKTYFYKIAVVQKENNKEAEDVSITRTTFNDVRLLNRPYPPTILTINSLVRRSEITFVPNFDNQSAGYNIVKYKAYRKAVNGGNWQNIGAINVAGESKLQYVFVDTNKLKDGIKYQYAVASVNSLNKESALSGTELVISPGTPNLVVSQQNMLRRVELNWVVETTANNAGFYIYRRPKGTTIWQRIGQVESNSIRNFIDTKDLSDGVEYEYYVSVFAGVMETDPSNVVSAKTKELPAVPQGLNVQSELVKSVRLTWTALTDSDIGAYKIYRMQDDGNGFQPGDQLTLVGEAKGGSTNEYLDTGSDELPLLDGTTYHYAIAAANKFGARGELSFVASAKTKNLPKGTASLNAIAGDGAIALTWPAATGAKIAKYHLYRKWNNEAWRQVTSLPASTLNYEDTDLKPYASTQYKVVAEDVDALLSSETLSDQVESPAKIELNLEQNNLLRRAKLIWNEQKNIVGYKLYRSVHKQDNFKLVKTFEDALTLNFTDKGKLKDGQRYDYYLTALDGFIETPKSNMVTASTKPVPNPPKKLGAVGGLVKEVNLRWQPIDDIDVDGYHIYRRVRNGKFERIETIDDRKIGSYTDDGTLFTSLSDGTEYLYIISAFNTYGAEGKRSNPAIITTKPKPAQVSGFAANKLSGKLVQLNWQLNPEQDIDKYVLQRASGESCSSYRSIVSLGNGKVEYIDSDVEQGKTYCYRIKAIDKDKLESIEWQKVQVSLPAAPTPTQ